ncbi:MAG: hypothetical protein IKR21_06420 [Oscillospiraceae bacterium]|nr:hypothetical protein [Oscillospiraceae bacterium]
MFEKRRREKEMRKKADQDAQGIYRIVNTILHHYPIGLSVFEHIAYYTLAVAYGNVLGRYPDDELVHLRNKLYFSNINSGSSASRGMFGIQYDQILSNHFSMLRANEKLDLLPIIKSVINQNNEIFPENPKSAEQNELVFICDIYTKAFESFIS